MSIQPKFARQFFTQPFGIAVAAIVGVMITLPSTASANSNSQPTFVQLKSEALHSAADDMRDEIKAHFRKSKVYGKMLGTNSRIKFRSGAIARRVKRNACYSGLDRDLRKLDDLVHELYELYEEAIERSIRCLDKPIVGSTYHVADKIGGMIDLTHCIMAAANGDVEVILAPSSIPELAPPATGFESSNQFGTKFERYRPNIDVAPGVPPAVTRLRQIEEPHVSELIESTDRYGKSVLRK